MAHFIELKMIVTKKFKLPENFDAEDFELLEDKLNVLTTKAVGDKISAIGDFLYQDIPSNRDAEDGDYDNVRFLGVITNG